MDFSAYRELSPKPELADYGSSFGLRVLQRVSHCHARLQAVIGGFGGSGGS